MLIMWACVDVFTLDHDDDTTVVLLSRPAPAPLDTPEPLGLAPRRAGSQGPFPIGGEGDHDGALVAQAGEPVVEVLADLVTVGHGLHR
jgi:hypothetical protein